MTFRITNIRIEHDQMVAFYEFANGEVNSNAFPLTATAGDVKLWGEMRAEWFVQREAEIAALVEEVANGGSDN